MYIELFLLDNTVMNALICMLAGALCSRRARVGRTALFSFGGAVYAAFAMHFKLLMTFPFKLALCAVMGMAMPFKGAKEYITGLVAMFAAAFITGGTAFFIVYATGGAVTEGGLYGSVSLRVMLIAALAAAAMPSLCRRMKRAKLAAEGVGKLTIKHAGGIYELNAKVDSGNTLAEPLSGLPVIVVYLPQLRNEANIPISARTVSGEEILFGLKPQYISFCGIELDAIVAISNIPTHPQGLIPPAAIPITFHLGGRM